MTYSYDEIESIIPHIQELFRISTELERIFPGRRVTLDGHLIGSIGEVFAAYTWASRLPTSTFQPKRRASGAILIWAANRHWSCPIISNTLIRG